MKKTSKFLLITAALGLVVGAGVVLATRGVKAPVKTEAWDSITNLPSLSSTFSTAQNQMWESEDDPPDGASANQSVYSTSLNSSTTGFKNYGNAVLSIESGTDNTLPYLKTSSASTKLFRAQYTPFRIGLTLNGYRKYNYKFTFEVHAKRYTTSTGQGAADYSSELFHYGSTAQTPVSWFYHQDDFTEATGRGFSKIRAAGDNSGAQGGVTKQVTIEFSMENNTATQGVFYQYFGLFCYVESSKYSGTFTGKVTLKSALVESTYAVATVNGTNCYTGASAVETYNASAGSTMTLLDNMDLSATHYALTSANGTVNFAVYTIDLGNRVLYVRANTTFNGNSNSKITSSFAYATICIDQAVSLTLSGSVSVVNTCTDTLTARAVLLTVNNAQLYVGYNNMIITKYYGVQIDNVRAGRSW